MEGEQEGRWRNCEGEGNYEKGKRKKRQNLKRNGRDTWKEMGYKTGRGSSVGSKGVKGVHGRGKGVKMMENVEGCCFRKGEREEGRDDKKEGSNRKKIIGTCR